MTSLIDRNWKDIVHYGNSGVTGNFFQKIREISADYTYKPGDGLLLVDTTTAEVIITLPPIADWPTKDFRMVIPIMHVAGANNVKIQLSGSETFLLGNTYFNLGVNVGSFDFYVINAATFSAYGILSDLTIEAEMSFTGTLANTGFVASAIVPLDTLENNSQDEILLIQLLSNGVIASAADGTTNTVLTDVAHGLTTGEVITIAGTTSYNDEYAVTVLTVDTFSIEETFVADESGTWIRSPRITVLTAANYKIGFSVNLDSTGGGAWSAIASIFKNGVELADTLRTVSGIAGENKSIISIPITETLAAGDYIDIRIIHVGLTGNLTDSLLGIKTTAL